ncbi:hypothetical protein LCGC14_0600480 [marine sediment metagenome]|uniref:Uncharacterized protein n=1 Tax=marine sediment metagenome TaxID=412755 RepID=A0A0F9RUN4_9ZZZZ
MRKCKQCNEPKELNEFPKYSSNGKKGRRHTCKICWNKKWSPIVQIHNKRYYHENIAYRIKARIRAKNQYSRDKNKHGENGKIYQKKHRLQCNVRMQTRRAITAGKLERKSCSVCGAENTHAHHDDYKKPFEVIWLCPTHHGEKHRIINRQAI